MKAGARLVGLDALRGIAAIAVALEHLDSQFQWTALGLDPAMVAVDFFFMLSGYVMARTYEARLAAGALTPLGFLRARGRRLWLTLAIGTTLGFLLDAGRFGLSAPLAMAFVLALCMLPSWPMRYGQFPFNGPAWSVFYELVANALHAAAFARMRTRSLVLLAIALSPALVIATFETGRLPRGTLAEDALAAVPRVLVPYLIGIVLQRRWRDVPGLRVPFALAAAALPLFVVAMALLPVHGAELAFMVLGAPVMIAGGLRAGENGRWLAMAAMLGGISYPLYAIHMPIYEIARHLALGPWPAFALALAAASLWLVDWRGLLSGPGRAPLAQAR